MSENKEKEVKEKKPIYKEWWFIIIVAVIVLIIASKVSNVIKNNTKGEKIDQSKLELGQYLPELPSKKGEIFTNTKENLWVKLYNVDKDKYNEYFNECKAKFNVDDSSVSDSLYAYNSENYKISMNYYETGKEISLNVYAPMKLEEITWPNSDVANSLPKPKSTIGKISIDKSNEFSVYIGNTSKSEYNEYVNNCSNSGYKVDYKKTDKEYTAKNENGYELKVSYSGGNLMYISVKEESSKPTSVAENTTSTTNENNKTPENNKEPETSNNTNTSTNQSGISKEFKDAMDSYESFMNEYVEFMKKYSANPLDATLIGQYATMMQRYTENISAFDKWNAEDMSTEEAKYYLDVQTRVNKKLSEIK